MKTLYSVVIGAVLVVILLSFLASSATEAMVLVQPCSVEEDGSGTHLTIQAAVSGVSCNPINEGAGTFIETVTIKQFKSQRISTVRHAFYIYYLRNANSPFLITTTTLASTM